MDTNKIYYVYHLIDPRDEKVFYIGKGKRKRMYVHMEVAARNEHPPKYYSNKHLFYKVKQIINAGLSVSYIKIIDNVCESDALAKEIEEIERVGINNLCNITIGGEGVTRKNYPPELIKKMSETSLALWETEEYRKKMIESGNICFRPRSGSEHPMYGRKHTERQKETAKARAGIPLLENHRNNIRLALIGREITWKEKISKSLKEWSKNHPRIVSEETRKKISKASAGKPDILIDEKTKILILELYKTIGSVRIHRELKKIGLDISVYVINRELKSYGIYKKYKKGLVDRRKIRVSHVNKHINKKGNKYIVRFQKEDLKIKEICLSLKEAYQKRQEIFRKLYPNLVDE